MRALDMTNKATNMGFGILHPKQQNRFTILFNSPSLTEEEQRALSMQVVRFEDRRSGDDDREFIEITFHDDISNKVLQAVRTLTDVADFKDLTIEVQVNDANDEVLATWLFLEAALDVMLLNKLDYATSEAVEITGVFEYQAWDLALRGDPVDAEA